VLSIFRAGETSATSCAALLLRERDAINASNPCFLGGFAPQQLANFEIEAVTICEIAQGRVTVDEEDGKPASAGRHDEPSVVAMDFAIVTNS
jgi:hypothetical protein